MEVNRNNGQPPADGHELPAHADGAIAPLAQQMNQQLPARTVRDYLAEDLEGLNPAVTMPDFEAEHSKLKPVMFNMLNTLVQFGGTLNENARQHLKSFLEICNSFKIHGVSNDVLKLKLFPYSLKDKAKTWLNNIQPGSLQSWTQLCRSFLAKFSYTNMTDHLRNQITSFRQEGDEAMIHARNDQPGRIEKQQYLEVEQRSAASRWQELPTRADGAIAPPAQQMNQQLPARTVRDYLAEDLEGLNPAVTMPDFEAEHFELKPVMFNMLNTLGQFGGTPNENARQHIKSFLEICNSFKIHGVSNDVLKLKLFPYSLRDKAKTWLNNLQPGSLQSWT
ncbi:hypothetical protein GQ457_04G018860 [Hibiscus cannabinus]